MPVKDHIARSARAGGHAVQLLHDDSGEAHLDLLTNLSANRTDFADQPIRSNAPQPSAFRPKTQLLLVTDL